MTLRKPARIIPIHPAGKAQPSSGSEPEFHEAVPLSLYVHIPWCVQKCPYCDFNSHPMRGHVPEEEYIAALIADLESALPLIWGRKIVSIFFGGGTPSLLSGAGLDALLAALRMRLPISPDAEITLEANPGTAEAGKFAAFRAAGITRLSLGIQSFDAAHLKALGRIHDGQEARRAIAMAQEHFGNFNLDLMYGLPGQSIEQARTDLREALSFSPPHLSCYQLTLEPNTAFAAAPPELPDPDDCADMQEAIETELAAAGFVHYETSAFAQPGHFCRHNLNYWTFGDYLGIGAGAHSKLTFFEHGRWQVRRQARWKQPKQYLAKVAEGQPLQEEFEVPSSGLPFEFMMNALRLNQGFDEALFAARTAQPLPVVMPILNKAIEDRLIECNGGRIAPTKLGQRFLNRLLEMFMV